MACVILYICHTTLNVCETEATIPTERAQSLVNWLKMNHAPIKQVVENMKETALYRATWIRQNGTKSIAEVLHEFPHLLNTPGMV